jgi:Transposase IS116/IS110/IS902 family
MTSPCIRPRHRRGNTRPGLGEDHSVTPSARRQRLGLYIHFHPDQTPEQLEAEAGAAPVTRASGKHRAVIFRWARNKRLRQAVMTFADNSRHASPWAAAVYARARARG